MKLDAKLCKKIQNCVIIFAVYYIGKGCIKAIFYSGMLMMRLHCGEVDCRLKKRESETMVSDSLLKTTIPNL